MNKFLPGLFFISLDLERSGKKFWALRICQALLVLAVFGLVVMDSGGSFFSKAPFLREETQHLLQKMSIHADYWQGIVTPIALLLVGLLERLVSGLNPWKRKVIQSCLDEFRDRVFAGNSHKYDPSYSHTVTLFRLQNGCIRMGKMWHEKWLVPVARSGAIRKTTTSIFWLSDDPLKIEGVAGKAWTLPSWYFAEDLSQPSMELSQAEREEYYTKTNITVDKALSRNYNARSYGAIKVEVKGKPWGVLVLDSTKEKLPKKVKINPHFKLLVSAISPVLESL
jgi:hypothetical protein